jgi:hypothetical protein
VKKVSGNIAWKGDALRLAPVPRIEAKTEASLKKTTTN